MKKLLIVLLTLALLLGILSSCELEPFLSEIMSSSGLDSESSSSEGPMEAPAPNEQLYSNDWGEIAIIIDDNFSRDVNEARMENGEVCVPVVSILTKMGAQVSWYSENIALIHYSYKSWVLDINAQTMVPKGSSNTALDNIIASKYRNKVVTLERDILVPYVVMEAFLRNVFNNPYIEVLFNEDDYIIDIMTNSKKSTNSTHGRVVYELSETSDYYMVKGVEWTSSITKELISIDIEAVYNGLPVKEIVSLDALKRVPETITSPDGYLLDTDADEIIYKTISFKTKVNDLRIPDSIEVISPDAFDVDFLGEIKLDANNKSYKYVDGMLYSHDGKILLVKSKSVNALSIEIPQGIEMIYAHAFKNDEFVVSIRLPDTLISIGDEAFYGCYRLVEVINESNLTLEIGDDKNGGVAKNARNLLLGNVESEIEIINDDFVFIKSENKNILLTYIGEGKKVELPHDIGDYEIAPQAFCNNKKVFWITIPSAVTRIGKDAFLGANNLYRVNIQSVSDYLNTKLDSLASTPFHYGALLYKDYQCIRSVTIEANITQYAFYNCDSIKEIIIDDGVTSIGVSAFAKSDSLERLVISDTVTEMREDAFAECTALNSIDFGESLVSIPEGAFSCCESLTEIEIPKSVVRIKRGAFAGCKKLRAVKLHAGLSYIGMGAFWGCRELRAIYVPFNSHIAENAFEEGTVIHRYHYD